MEPIVCIHCGKPIDKFDNDPRKAEYEAKWHIHYACRELIEDMLDRKSGVASTRK